MTPGVSSRGRSVWSLAFLGALICCVFAAAGELSAALEADATDPCTVRGTPGADVLSGTPGDDVICGFGGDDVLRGGAGKDRLLGGSGNDQLQGGGDNDRLRGGAGDDQLSGNGGNDNLRGGAGADRMSGGAGSDLGDYLASDEGVSLSAGNGANDGARGEGDELASDVENLRGGSGNDLLQGNAGANWLHGFGGADRVRGGMGNDRLYGGMGGDSMDARDAAGFSDDVFCGGGGSDGAMADTGDHVRADCENVNQNHAPTDLSLSPASVGENEPVGTTVGTLSATDQDTGDTQAYSLITGDGSGDNGSFTLAGATLRTNAIFDYESKRGYSIRIRVADGFDANYEKQLTITVTDKVENINPIAVDDSRDATEDTQLELPLSGPGSPAANDSDADADPLAVTDVSAPAGGSVAIVGGLIRFDPAANLCGAGAGGFDYTVSDGRGGTDVGRVTVDLTCTPDDPTVVDDSATVAEDAAATTIDVLANDSDPDGEPVTIDTVVPPTNGTVVITNSGADLTYEPAGNYCGPDSFTYTVVGGPTGTVDVTVTCVNDAPVVTPATVSLPENSANGIAVHTVAFSDVESSQGHTFAITAGDPDGAFAIDQTSGAITVADSTLLDFETTTSFDLTVQVTDDGTPPESGSATITVNLTDTGEPPVVDPATFTVAEDAAAGDNVGTVTFTDPDAGQNHTFAITAGNTGGAFAIDAATGEITVAQPLDFETTTSYDLTVEVTDDGSPPLSDTATITVNVTNVNESPSITAPATVSVQRDIPVVVAGISVADPDAGDIELTLAVGDGTLDVDETASAATVTGDGTATVVITGTDAEINAILTAGVTYLNDVGFPGLTDTLQLDVDDLGTPALTASATVTLQFNQPPVAADISETTDEDTAVVVTLSGTDADDDDLAFAIVTGPTNGTLGAIGTPDCTTVANTCTAQVTYSPNDDFNGSDQFTYQVDDGDNTDTGTVDITVDPVNDAPVAVADSFSTDEDTLLDVPAPGVLGNDTDIDAGTTLTAGLVTGPTHAESFTLNADGSFAYTPADDYNGPDSFTYVANDGTADSNTATVSLTVNAVPDAPIVVTSAGDASFTEGAGPVQVDPAVLVTDVDGGNLASARVQLTGGCQPGEDVLTLASPPAGITVAPYVPATCTLDLTGPAPIAAFQTALRAVTYSNTSDAPSTSTRTATFTADDGALTGSDTRNITVAAVNDAPVITLSGSTPTFTEDGAAVTVDGGLTVTDPDDTDLETGTVTISAGLQAGDALTFAPGVTGIIDTNAAPEILALTGTATIADWQTVLRSIQFSTTNQAPTTARTVAFTVGDGTDTSATVNKTVTVVPVNDAPVLNQPDAAALDYTEGAAATIIAPNITAADVDSANLVGATIDIGANGQDVLSLGTNPQNGISAGAFDTVNGTLTLTGSSSVANYQTALRDVRFANTSDNPTGGLRNVTYQVDDGPGPNDLSNVVSRNVNVIPVNDPPVAGDDSFTGANGALANTRLAVGTTTTGPHLATAGTVLSNDTDPDTPLGLTAGPGTISSANCAGCNNVALNANGTFTYDPPAGFTGTDTFTYTVNDNDPEAPPNQTDIATVSIQVFGPVVWYVDVDAAAPPAGQGGRSHSPFQSLAPLTTGGAADGLDGANDVIFLGADSAAPIAAYDGGIVLETNQRLLGEPFGLSIDPGGPGVGPGVQTLVAPSGNPDPATNPNVRNSAVGGVGMTLANGVEVQRVNAGITGAGSATGISGAAVTTATVGPNLLVQSNTDGVSLSGAAGGNISVAATIAGNTGAAVNVANRSSGTVTFSGPVGGTAVTLANNAGGFVVFSGALNLANAGAAVTAFSATGGGTITATNAANQIAGFAGTGISLNAVNIGAGGVSFNTVSSAGGGAANGILLTNVGGAGSLTVTGGAITATTRGLDVDDNSGNVTLGASLTTSGASARSVEVTNRDGGTVDLNGLVTDNSQGINLTSNGTGTVRFDGGIVATTGANGAFNATGGGTVAVTGAANTLTTTTGTALNVQSTTIHADDLTFQSISADEAPNGIALNNTGSLGSLVVTGDGDGNPDGGGGTIQNTTGHGVSLSGTLAPSLTDVSVVNAGNADNEYGLFINNVGTVTLDDMSFNNAADNLVYLTSTTSSTVNVTGSAFTYPATIGPAANSAILLEPGGAANLTASVTGSTFTNIVSASTQIGANTAGASGTLSLTFSNNTINSGPGRAGGVVVSGQELTTTSLSIVNNTFSGAGGNGVISIDVNDASTVTGTIQSNTINNPPGIGIFSAVDEAATSTLTFNANTVTNAGGDGIQLVNFGSPTQPALTSTMNATVTNNVVNGHSLNTAVSFVGGISVTGFEEVMDLQLTGNAVTGTPASPTQCGGAPCVDYYLEEVGGTFRLEEIPDTAATTANAAYVNSTNDAGPVTIFGVIDLSNGVEISST